MFTQEEYLWAWSIYGVSSLFLIGCWWGLTAKIPFREVRGLLRLIPLILLIVPWRTNLEQDYLAPAWFTSSADALTDGEQAFWRAGLVLVIALALGILISFFYFCWRWARSHNNEPKHRDANNRGAMQGDFKSRGSKSRDAKPRDAKPRDAKPRDAKPRDAKPRDAKKNRAQHNSSKPNKKKKSNERQEPYIS